MKRKLIKSVSFGTALLFLLNTVAYSAPDLSLSWQAFTVQEPLAIQSLEIPSELGSIRDSFIAPESKLLIVHIQDAHGNYEAQKNIRSLIEYLHQQHRINLLLLEGGSGKLNPDLFKFFKDHRLNQKVADILMKQGEFTGAESFLLDADSKVEGYGIENVEAYRRDVEFFRRALSARNESDRLIQDREKEMRQLEARVFSKDLKQLLRANRAPTLPFIRTLDRLARKTLELDLKDARNQDEYPSLLRLLRLAELEPRLDLEKAAKEKEALIRFVGATAGRPGERRSPLQNIEKALYPRFVFEHIVEKQGPRLDFRNYPHFSRYAQYLIFQSEIGSEALMKEIENLTDRILERLAKTKEEKELVERARNLELLCKLLHLELTRGEWEKLKRSTVDSPQSTEKSPGFLSVDCGPWTMDCFQFYRLACERENHFFDEALSVMKKKRAHRAILISGGFHSEGLKARFKEKGISYLEISPRIGSASDSKAIYLESMLGKSQISNILHLIPLSIQEKMGALLEKRERDIFRAKQTAASLGARQGSLETSVDYNEIERLSFSGNYRAAWGKIIRSFLRPVSNALESLKDERSDADSEQKLKEAFKQLKSLSSDEEQLEIRFNTILMNLFAFLASKDPSASLTQKDARQIYDSFIEIPEIELDSVPIWLKPFSISLFRWKLQFTLEDVWGLLKHPEFKSTWFSKLISGIYQLFVYPVHFVLESRNIQQILKADHQRKKLLAGIVLGFIKKKTGLSDDAFPWMDSQGLLTEGAIIQPKEFVFVTALLTVLKSGYPVPQILSQDEVLHQGEKVVNIGIYDRFTDDGLALLEESSKREDANFILLLGPSGVQFSKRNGKRIVQATSGLVMKNDQPAFVSFEPPLPLHYFADQRRSLIRNKLSKTRVPEPASLIFEEYEGEKDIATEILRAKGVRVPRTLVLIAKNHPHKIIRHRREAAKNIHFLDKNDRELESKLKAILGDFVREHEIDLVMKPNRGNGGRGVRFFEHNQLSEAVEEAARRIREERNVIIQERIEPPWIVEEDSLLDWNFRVFVSRDETGRPVASDMLIRVAPEGQAINISRGAWVITPEELGETLSLTERELNRLREDVSRTSIDAYLALQEAMRKDGVIGPVDTASDFMGMDVIVTPQNGRLIPYVMEVNGYQSGGMWDLDDHLRAQQAEGIAVEPGRIGRASRDWVRTMVGRAREYKALLDQGSSRAASLGALDEESPLDPVKLPSQKFQTLKLARAAEILAPQLKAQMEGLNRWSEFQLIAVLTYRPDDTLQIVTAPRLILTQDTWAGRKKFAWISHDELGFRSGVKSIDEMKGWIRVTLNFRSGKPTHWHISPGTNAKEGILKRRHIPGPLSAEAFADLQRDDVIKTARLLRTIFQDPIFGYPKELIDSVPVMGPPVGVFSEISPETLENLPAFRLSQLVSLPFAREASASSLGDSDIPDSGKSSVAAPRVCFTSRVWNRLKAWKWKLAIGGIVGAFMIPISLIPDAFYHVSALFLTFYFHEFFHGYTLDDLDIPAWAKAMIQFPPIHFVLFWMERGAHTISAAVNDATRGFFEYWNIAHLHHKISTILPSLIDLVIGVVFLRWGQKLRNLSLREGASRLAKRFWNVASWILLAHAFGYFSFHIFYILFGAFVVGDPAFSDRESGDYASFSKVFFQSEIGSLGVILLGLAVFSFAFLVVDGVRYLGKVILRKMKLRSVFRPLLLPAIIFIISFLWLAEPTVSYLIHIKNRSTPELEEDFDRLRQLDYAAALFYGRMNDFRYKMCIIQELLNRGKEGMDVLMKHCVFSTEGQSGIFSQGALLDVLAQMNYVWQEKDIRLLMGYTEPDVIENMDVPQRRNFFRLLQSIREYVIRQHDKPETVDPDSRLSDPEFDRQIAMMEEGMARLVDREDERAEVIERLVAIMPQVIFGSAVKYGFPPRFIRLVEAFENAFGRFDNRDRFNREARDHLRDYKQTLQAGTSGSSLGTSEFIRNFWRRELGSLGRFEHLERSIDLILEVAHHEDLHGEEARKANMYFSILFGGSWIGKGVHREPGTYDLRTSLEKSLDPELFLRHFHRFIFEGTCHTSVIARLKEAGFFGESPLCLILGFLTRTQPAFGYLLNEIQSAIRESRDVTPQSFWKKVDLLLIRHLDDVRKKSGDSTSAASLGNGRAQPWAVHQIALPLKQGGLAEGVYFLSQPDLSVAGSVAAEETRLAFKHVNLRTRMFIRFLEARVNHLDSSRQNQSVLKVAA